MPPRRTIDRDIIIKEAFEIVREAGWEALTARNLAKRLKSSTMPLYSTLKSMEEIKAEIRKLTTLLMHEYQRRTYTSDSLLNGAIGYVTFANEERHLFRFLFLEQGQYEAATGNWLKLETIIPFDSGLDLAKLIPGLSEEALKQIMQRGWIFTHGLAMMVNNGIIPFDREEISKLLEENGMAQGMFILNRETKYKEVDYDKSNHNSSEFR